MGWFEVDKDGLARILKRRGLEFIAFELISNAWDSEATQVSVTLAPVGTKRLARLTVEDDDPNGFADISHAYTMFADSNRREDASKRGRFNLGEKLVLAIAREAKIVSTTAAYNFDETGRHRLMERTERGSRVEIVFPATHAEIQEIIDATTHLIPPVPTTVNGIRLEKSEPLTTFEASLETVLPDDEGNLRSRVRKTTVEVYQNGTGRLYELGVPVVETGDTYSYNVNQKIPVNLDRDNVPPAYLRTLRVFALNNLHDKLDPEMANQTWARDAMSDDRASVEAVKSAITQRFGEKAVAFDPSDLEANARATAEGYTVVAGRSLSGKEWENAKKADALPAAGRVTLTPKPISPDGKPIELLPEHEWTPGMKLIVQYTHKVFKAWFGHEINVFIGKAQKRDWGAAYGKDGQFYFNLNSLKSDWFDQGITDDVVALLIHEAGHEIESNHLSVKYYDALCELGAQMRNLKHLEEGL
jgi:hypothetical protein